MTKAELAARIDHTLLRPDASTAQIEALCREAVGYGFGAVCVNPSRAGLARRCLRGTGVRLCVVIGFPLGASGDKAGEAAAMAALGADELDMVMDIGAAKDGDWDWLEHDIRMVRSACPGKILKVILEMCLLTEAEKINACHAAVLAGADFVKTSTGFSTGGATVEDVQLLRRECGVLGVKASGGIRTAADARAMLEAGADRLGVSAGVAILNEWECSI